MTAKTIQVMLQKSGACAAVLVIAFVAYGIAFISDSPAFNTYVVYRYMTSIGQKAFHGSDGWLFYRTDIACMAEPWRFTKGNLRSFSALNDSLAARGIALIIVPVPDKSAIIQHHSPFHAATPGKQRTGFLKALQHRGIRVVDLLTPFQSDAHRDSLYRRKDTHWDNRGIGIAAQLISQELQTIPGPSGDPPYPLRDTMVSEQGDLAMLLGDSAWYNRTSSLVSAPDGTPWRDSLWSDVMIFGDSFAGNSGISGTRIGARISCFSRRPTYTFSGLSSNVRGPSTILRLVNSRHTTPRVVVWVFSSRFLLEKFAPAAQNGAEKDGHG